MADPLLELLLNEQAGILTEQYDTSSSSAGGTYLSRLLSLRPSDLTSTEPQSLAQTSQSNLLSIQALSSRSHRSTTTSSDQLATLQQSIPVLTSTITSVKNSVPSLDDAATTFASTYSKARSTTIDESNHVLTQRKQSMLFSRQAERLQDILELPGLLSTAIASAASGPAGSANYTQALDLFAHIRRLQILYPDSRLVADVLIKAEVAMKEMTMNLVESLRGQNIRLAAAIRTIGWLRRVVPELGVTNIVGDAESVRGNNNLSFAHAQEELSEGSFGALFLVARLSTFISMTEDALAPLRDLADQETEKRTNNSTLSNGNDSNGGDGGPTARPIQPTRQSSANVTTYAGQGQQTERYLKRYIEIFREQSFATIQMYRNVFPLQASGVHTTTSTTTSTSTNTDPLDEELIQLPTALASFPLHLVGLLMDTLQTYLPNLTDAAARESLLVQVLYAANSLGRLGADFSMMISLLDLPGGEPVATRPIPEESGESVDDDVLVEPEWYRVVRKHRVQAARLDALASGQENAARRQSHDVVAVR